MEPSLVQWLVLNFTAFMYGFNKTGIVGSAIICTPLMLLYFTPGQTLGVILPLLVIADIITIIILRQSAKWKYILKATPWALLGIVIGWWVARYTINLPEGGDALLRKIISGILVFLVLFGVCVRLRPGLATSTADGPEGAKTANPRTWFACLVGTIGGITTMLANNAGPAWVVYLMSLGLSIKEFLSTAAWLFFIQNLTKVPFGINLGFINADTLHTNLYLLPALFVGLAVGRVAINYLSKQLFDNITQVLALAGALYLLFS